MHGGAFWATFEVFGIRENATSHSMGLRTRLKCHKCATFPESASGQGFEEHAARHGDSGNGSARS